MSLLMQFIAIPLALLYANMIEWVIHKYVLHGLGRKKGSMWSFHWHEHHKISRKCGGLDLAYANKRWWKLDSVGKERLGLFLLLVLHSPVVFYYPLAYFALVYSTIKYFYVHRKTHTDIEWAKTHAPWHYDHHMGRNQDANWCVTKPWFDYVMGTRVYYSYKTNDYFKKQDEK